MNNHHLFELIKPVVFAHRGASKYAPENTLASFQKALEMGAQALELDVTLTRDGEVVVIHDDAVDRTSNGQGRVDQLTLAQIKKFDAGSWFAEEFKGEKIPTLKEVLALVGEKALINIELKNAGKRNIELVQETVNLVKEMKNQETIIFSSFIPHNIRTVRDALPECPAGLLTLPGFAGRVEMGLLGGISPDLIHPHYSNVTEKFIRRQHRRYRRVHTYTVNDPQLMRKLIRWQLDGFFCDDLLLAQQILAGIP